MTAYCLVDPKVARMKFDKEIEELLKISLILRKKGWIIEDAEFPRVRVTFLTAKVKPIIAPFTVEIDYTNYNILPPSVKFLDPITFEPIIVQGFQNVNGQAVNIVITKHPITKLPFFCMVGIQEYHSHPQHDGDVWDIYRYSEKDDLIYILDKIWLYCISSIKTFIAPPFQHPVMSLGFEAK